MFCSAHSQLRGLHRLHLGVDALQAGGELPPERERPHKEHLELLLRDDPKVSVAQAIEQQVDGGVEGQQEVGDHRQVGDPGGPGGLGLQPGGGGRRVGSAADGLYGEMRLGFYVWTLYVQWWLLLSSGQRKKTLRKL